MKAVLTAAMIAALVTGSLSTVALAKGSSLGAGGDAGLTLVEIDQKKNLKSKRTGFSSTFKGFGKRTKAKHKKVK